MTHVSQIINATVTDVRFPTSLELDGSDAVNVDPDYSAAYLHLQTDEGPDGHALVFTGGRGNEVVAAAIESAVRLLPNEDLETMLGHLGYVSDRLVHDSQFRWIGPEKGASHMAAGAVVNALWDIKAKRAGLPLWELLARMAPEELVEAVDFSHLRDAITEDEALAIFTDGQQGKEERIAELKEHGFPAYTTSAGWLGYSDEKMQRLAREAVDEGFGLIKLKVGGSLEDDVRRMKLARETVGPDVPIAIDANQKWEVHEAADWINALAPFDVYWVEEPTSPDDVLGHARIRGEIAPIKVATGEAVQNRIIFKQLLQAEAIDIMQIDSTRVAGPNENLANMLLAKKFGIPVCPHAGGVGLCELVVHFSFVDYAIISTSQEGRVIEFVDHLHEHFVSPVSVVNGRYRAPTAPGNGAEMFPASVQQWAYPQGQGWLDLFESGAFQRP
ncbi:mandelate racemase [Microlunatus panaciterrae]|uniref:L-fuconate dehydratase n=1 Tax=Microlunatus panaciterrae TaxID=400768 RepID=A0ABS2RKS1_9ACTN|nr:enolase C-terminal domain-like protein [Microlunatus panaciterrae]MBM7799087.1 L-fuconate dehydratase [Microlunatus panaciterrae]